MPTPDFDPFFEQRADGPVSGVVPTLLAETARGCWWGERSHCTFCGLNGATMAFRSKSPERVVDELAYLRDRYGVRSVQHRRRHPRHALLQDGVPMLAEADLGLELFWEIKANLTDRQSASSATPASPTSSPAIESLNDHVLELMRKGTTRSATSSC